MLRSPGKLPVNILDLEMSDPAGQEQSGLNGSYFDVLVGQSLPSVYDGLAVGDIVDQDLSSANSDRSGDLLFGESDLPAGISITRAVPSEGVPDPGCDSPVTNSFAALNPHEQSWSATPDVQSLLSSFGSSLPSVDTTIAPANGTIDLGASVSDGLSLFSTIEHQTGTVGAGEQARISLLPPTDPQSTDGTLYRDNNSDFGTGGLEGGTVNAGQPVGTITQLADYLVNGYWQAGGQTPHHWSNNTITYNLGNLTASEQALATSALNLWHEVANLNFVLTTGSANITFNHDGTMTASTRRKLVQNGQMCSATVDISSDWITKDGGANDGRTGIYSYGYQTYVHEIGHALGLGHQGPYNGSATYRPMRPMRTTRGNTPSCRTSRRKLLRASVRTPSRR